MTKRSSNARRQEARKRDEWPVVVYLWIFGLGFGGYLILGRFILAYQPHPVHWAAGLAGGLLGVPVGWLWYRWRGDIIP